MLRKIINVARLKGLCRGIKISKGISVIGVISLLLGPVVVYGQIGDYQKYSDIPGSSLYNFDIEEDIKYGAGKTKYQKLNLSGTYDSINQIDLELDLFVPTTPGSVGKRAVIIMVAGGGRSGCRTGGVKYLPNGSVDLANGCDQETLLTGSKVTQEGVNYNHLNNSIASNYAQRGLVVASITTRYKYQHTDFKQDGSNRWYRSADGTDDGTNPKQLLSSGSAHLEFLVVDIKRVVRWLTANADNYNIDPNYIFIEGGSGGAKMVALAAITNENQLIVDDPANIDVAFEQAHNNWGIRNSTPGIKGALLRKGDLNGNYHLDLMDTMSANTDSFMFWTGTADKAILHGMSEVIEEKCEILQTCSTQLYSLANETHPSSSSATFAHTKSGNKSVWTHAYDFMVNAIDKDKGELPVISISQQTDTFSESVGNAQIEITRSGDTSAEVVFTISADQMREVTLENAKQGSFDLITKYVAKSSNSDGLVMYDDSTGYVYEDAFGGNLRKSSDRVLRHTSGKGAGEYTEISSGDDEYHDVDFTGKTEVITLSSGQTSAIFNVNILNDDLLEDNECFKVRLLNAYGARIGNPMETITIEDDDRLNPSTHGVCGNPFYEGGSNNSPPTVTLNPSTRNVTEGGGFTLGIESNKVVSQDVSIAYQTRAGTASAADFTWVNQVAVIPAGQSSVNVAIQTTQDALVEVNERFTVELNQVIAGNAQLGTSDITTVTIVDDDGTAPTTPIISLSRTTKAAVEGGGFTLGIESNQVVTEDVSILYQTRVGTASSADFIWVNQVAVIPSGQSGVDVAIQTTQDTLVEVNEQFTVELNQVIAGDAQFGTTDTTIVTIVDDDDTAPTASIISLSRTTKAIVEGGGFTLGIESNQIVSQDVSIAYQTRVGTAASTDFTWVYQVAVIPAGQISVNVAIQTTQDALVEANEQFTVELNQVIAGNAQLGTTDTTTVTIVDTVVGAADVCGVPSFSSSSEKGLFVWKDCVGTGDWFMRATAGGGDATTYDGILLADTQFVSATEFSFEGIDNFQLSNLNMQLDFEKKMTDSGVDGLDLSLGSPNELCLTLAASDQTIFIGSAKIAFVSSSPLNLLAPGNSCGVPPQ